MKSWVRLGLLAALVAAVPAAPLAAGAKYTAQGFAFDPKARSQVVVVRPNLFMGTLDSANRQIEDPEWLAAAHVNLQEALKRHPATKAVEWRFSDWNAPSSQKLSEAFWKSVQLINGDIVFKVPQGTFPVLPGEDWQKRFKPLPKGYHPYQLPAASLEELRQVDPDARFALLIATHDAYTTDGAKLARLLGGMGNVVSEGVNTMAPPPHHGFTMLVDLADGKVVWFYNDGAFGGDLRKPTSADKRVGQMLTGWPGGR